MAGKPRLALVLTDAERRTLQGWARRRKTAQGLAQRARIVLLCADGKTNVAVAAELGITRETAGRRECAIGSRAATDMQRGRRGESSVGGGEPSHVSASMSASNAAQ